MRDGSRLWWQRAFGHLAALLLCAAYATIAAAAPITYQFTGTGSGTIGGTPFADAAYVITADGDSAAVEFHDPFPNRPEAKYVTNAVTVKISVEGIGVATLTPSSYVTNAFSTAQLSYVLSLNTLAPITGLANDALYAYTLQASIGPLVSIRPIGADVSNQASDLGLVTLTSSSAVTFQATTTCGDGVVDAFEECDDGNFTSGDCCSPGCRFDAPNAPCLDDGLTCTADVCDGAGSCNHPARADGVSCYSNSTCHGGGGTCLDGVCLGPARDCDDGIVCTRDSCEESIGCIHLNGPASGCLVAQKSKLMLKPSGAGKTMLKWRWIKGAAIAFSDLSDPTVDADYELCVYGGPASDVVASAALPAGSNWSTAGTRGYKFSDTAPPTALRLRSGVAGRSMAVMGGRAVDLLQVFPLAAPVTVQLHKIGSPLCLESHFATPTRSDATKFDASAP